MHMSDALLSPAVGITMCAVSAVAAVGVAAGMKKEMAGDKKIPLMAVSGAFIFAAQMINFSIPGTGSSGHIGGGILLACMLGGGPAFLAIIPVLVIQCLFFADGGLLALGCNVFNIGVLPCLVIWPLITRPILKKGRSPARIALAGIASAIVGLQLGAFAVVLETTISGITELPFGTFVAFMQPIHLAIGLVEGIITAAVVIYVQKARPEVVDSSVSGTLLQPGVRTRKVVTVLLVLAVLVAGGLSLLASSNPDGLEWAIGKTAGDEELTASGGVYDDAAAAQDATAVMPDYDYAGGEGTGGTTVAGIAGAVMTLVLAGAVGGLITVVRKRRVKAEKPNN